jgi:hypothetical protein
MALKIKLIDNWRKAHKFASVWWCLFGLVCAGLEFANNTWISLPPHIHEKIPNDSTISGILFIFIILARVIEFAKPETDDGCDCKEGRGD